MSPATGVAGRCRFRPLAAFASPSVGDNGRAAKSARPAGRIAAILVGLAMPSGV